MRKSGRDRLIKMRALRLLPLSAREGSALALQWQRGDITEMKELNSSFRKKKMFPCAKYYNIVYLDKNSFRYPTIDGLQVDLNHIARVCSLVNIGCPVCSQRAAPAFQRREIKTQN